MLVAAILATADVAADQAAVLKPLAVILATKAVAVDQAAVLKPLAAIHATKAVAVDQAAVLKPLAVIHATKAVAVLLAVALKPLAVILVLLAAIPVVARRSAVADFCRRFSARRSRAAVIQLAAMLAQHHPATPAARARALLLPLPQLLLQPPRQLQLLIQVPT
jgi:hypothetical protein